MNTFYLIRHGLNDMVGKAIAGWVPGVHLNKEGREQADRLAEYLAKHRIQHIFSSPLERAQETAQPLATKLGLQLQTADELGEVHYGDWNGQLNETLNGQPRWKQWNAFRTGTRIPKGEMIVEVQARMVAFIQKLRQDSPDQKVALVSHGDPIRATLAYYLGIPLDFILRFEVDPASISILTLDDYAPRVLCINDGAASH